VIPYLRPDKHRLAITPAVIEDLAYAVISENEWRSKARPGSGFVSNAGIGVFGVGVRISDRTGCIVCHLVTVIVGRVWLSVRVALQLKLNLSAGRASVGVEVMSGIVLEVVFVVGRMVWCRRVLWSGKRRYDLGRCGDTGGEGVSDGRKGGCRHYGERNRGRGRCHPVTYRVVSWVCVCMCVCVCGREAQCEVTRGRREGSASECVSVFVVSVKDGRCVDIEWRATWWTRYP
jgi:hypothetical protein